MKNYPAFRLVVCAVLLGLVFGFSPARAAETPGYVVNLSLNTADFEGYAQTPQGGAPGTSDLERPTLDELNMDDSLFYRLEAAGHWDFGIVYVGADLISMDGSGTLEEDLVTRQPFTAGTAYDAELTWNWYRIGYAYPFHQENGSFWAPSVDVALLDFDYRFETAGETITRRYSKAALRLGMSGRWNLSPAWALAASGTASLPFSNTPQIADGRATAHWRVWHGNNGARAELFGGVGLLYIDYEDNQELPNHLHLEASPYFTAGVSVGF